MGDRCNQGLLDLGFLEIDVLAGNRVILTLDHFIGHRTAVFLRHIIKAGVSSAFQLDFDGCGLCHDLSSCLCRIEEMFPGVENKTRLQLTAARVGPQITDAPLKVKV